MAGAIRLDDPTDEQIDTLCTQLVVWLKRARRIPNVTIEVRDLQATIDRRAHVDGDGAPDGRRAVSRDRGGRMTTDQRIGVSVFIGLCVLLGAIWAALQVWAR
jgi:hypothetical protein